MPLLSRKIETRSLSSSDMKKLVRILQGVPSGLARKNKEDAYVKGVKRSIKALPSRLRAPKLTLRSTSLCHIHKGLDDYLINDIWAWVKHEFEGAIVTTRQLEPVLEMWREDFNLAVSPPPDHAPINVGSRWYFQENKCPACLLARIGSDLDVLGTLFMGMAGRNPSTQRSFFRPEEIKHKRLRFVRYWIKSHPSSAHEISEKYELAVELKEMRGEAKKRIESRNKSFFYKRYSLVSPAPTVEKFGADALHLRDTHGRSREACSASQKSRRNDNVSPPRSDFTTPSRAPSTSKSSSRTVSESSPRVAARFSRPPNLPAAIETRDYPARHSPAPLRRKNSILSPLPPKESYRHASTSRPASKSSRHPPRRSIPKPPLRKDSTVSPQRVESQPYTSPAPRPASSVYSVPSRASQSTILSYDRAPSSLYTPPRPAPIDRFLSSRAAPPSPTLAAAETEAMLNMSASQAELTHFPLPRPQSMYASYCDASFDEFKFDHVDVSPPATPTESEAVFDRNAFDCTASIRFPFQGSDSDTSSLASTALSGSLYGPMGEDGIAQWKETYGG